MGFKKSIVKTGIIIASSLFIGLISCKKGTSVMSPAQVVTGNYIAKTYNDAVSPLVNYPINGQTINLQIKPVSKDTVQVSINSTINGFYSPGSSVTYLKAYVKYFFCNTCQYHNNYTIYLVPSSQGNADNTISFDPDFNAYFTYIPPGYTKGNVQSVFSKIN